MGRLPWNPSTCINRTDTFTSETLVCRTGDGTQRDMFLHVTVEFPQKGGQVSQVGDMKESKQGSIWNILHLEDLSHTQSLPLYLSLVMSRLGYNVCPPHTLCCFLESSRGLMQVCRKLGVGKTVRGQPLKEKQLPSHHLSRTTVEEETGDQLPGCHPPWLPLGPTPPAPPAGSRDLSPGWERRNLSTPGCICVW